MCKNHLSVKIVVHICFWCVKVSVRKRFCCVKTVLGKSFCVQKKSVCKNFSVQSVCTSFSVSNVFCVEKNMRIFFSVQRFLCAEGSVCKNAYVPLFMRAKTCLHKACVCKYLRFCLKTSVCKGVSVQKFFCAKTFLCKNICA